VEPASNGHTGPGATVAETINDRDLTALLNLAHPDIECQPLELSSGVAYTGRVGLTEWILELIVAAPGVRVRIERGQALSEERAAVFGTVHLNGEDLSPYALVGRPGRESRSDALVPRRRADDGAARSAVGRLAAPLLAL
jgi:hypothetical protein